MRTRLLTMPRPDRIRMALAGLAAAAAIGGWATLALAEGPSGHEVRDGCYVTTYTVDVPHDAVDQILAMGGQVVDLKWSTGGKVLMITNRWTLDEDDERWHGLTQYEVTCE